MLGDKIGEFHGKITGQRVLPPEGGRAKFETTTEISGAILGIPTRSISTYVSVMQADGSFYGEIVGAVFIAENGDMAHCKASGAGRFTGDGGVSFRGATYALGATGKLAPLNGLALVYEWDVDGNGNAQWHLWEWK
jgi:hypothetical protein